MTPELRRRAEELFQIAADLAPHECDRFLDEHCGAEKSLRAEVERLLAPADSELDEFLRTPVYIDARQEAEAAAKLPTRIGHYTIVRKVGEGGMGVVYEAKQDSPYRTVALKVIRSTLQSRAVAHRFEHEADILGRLQHPGIAHIYEAGTAPVGEDSPDATRYPYFAMEFIRGRTLIQHANEERLGTRRRMELVAAVCDAVDHAHRNGIIHRDLKPANILVNQLGEPRILDFGVARVTDDEIQSRTLQTGVGQLVGTLPYMSPEQVTGNAKNIDARSDVYALGVVLFELLAAKLPHDLRDRSIPDAVRVIREEEPTRLSSANPLFRGDVETIVGKALDKDPDRRYQTAAELADDIRRYLCDEPIVARPASTLYQLRKFTKRNKALVGGVIATVFVLLVGAVVAAVLAIRESEARRLADDKTSVAERLAYRTSIAAAAAALGVHDRARARRHLELAPEALRGWEWGHLTSRLDDSLVTIRLGRIGACKLAFSPDGKQVFVMVRPAATEPFARQAQVLAYDAGSAALLSSRTVEYRGDLVPDADWRQLTYVAADLRLVIEDTWRGDTRVVQGVGLLAADKTGPWPSARISPNELLVQFADRSLSAFDLQTHTLRSLSAGQPRYGSVFALSPDGRWIAYMVGGLDRTQIVVRDLATGELVRTFSGHRESVTSMAFSPDSTRIVTGSGDHTVRLWTVEGSGHGGWAVIDDHTDRVGAVAFSPDGNVLASGSQDRTLRLWDASTGEALATYIGHEAEIEKLAFSPDGTVVASTGEDGTVRIWDASPAGDPRVLEGHHLYIYPVALSPDENRIASGSWDGTVRFWDAASGAPIASIAHPAEPRTIVTWLAYHPDGSMVALTELRDSQPRSHWLRLVDTDTGKCSILARRPESWTSVAFHPNGSLVAATGVETGEVHIWDPSTLEELHRVPGERFCAFSSDGTRLATASGRDILVYDTPAFESAATLSGHHGPPLYVAFNPHNERLASAGADQTVRVWDLDHGNELAVLRGHTDVVYSVAYSPDGQRIASGSNDKTIRLWDANAFVDVALLSGHKEHVFALVFNSDGTQLISGSGDYTVRIWETQPLRDRVAARRARADSVRRLTRLVDRLFGEHADPAEFVARLRHDTSLDDHDREIALQMALGRIAETAPRRGS